MEVFMSLKSLRDDRFLCYFFFLFFAYIGIIFEEFLNALQKAACFLVAQLSTFIDIVNVKDFVDFVA